VLLFDSSCFVAIENQKKNIRTLIIKHCNLLQGIKIENKYGRTKKKKDFEFKMVILYYSLQ